jgi:lipoic acid synthetase
MRRPSWLRVKLPAGKTYADTHGLVEKHGLRTVCQSARCPNVFECFSKKTATFLILGGQCTRACAFCNIGHATQASLPLPDPDEPRRVALAALELGLAHAVVTSVTRDDLPDGGAAHFAATVEALRAAYEQAGARLSVELLIPDFQGDAQALALVLAAAPDVLNHNVETVPRLYPQIRPQADYARSLELLRRAADSGATAKSGLMVGLGEQDEEVEVVLADLASVGCGLVTIGQYLPPSREHLAPARYVEPALFERYAAKGKALGLPQVHSGPLVRSSYHAADFL